MSIRNRTSHEFERRQVSVVSLERNNNNAEDGEQPPKRAFLLRRRIPPEILDDLPESSVDPSPADAGVCCGSGVDRSAPHLPERSFAREISAVGGRAITLIGSPANRLSHRSTSVDYDRKLIRIHMLPMDVCITMELEWTPKTGRGDKNKSCQSVEPPVIGYAHRVNLPRTSEERPQQPRSLVCQECSGGTVFGLYHTPDTGRTLEVQAQQNYTGAENRWERSSLPSHSTFSNTPSSSAPPTPEFDPSKTFHYTPELRYKPVYFGDPRLRRFSCGYTERRPSREIVVSGLQVFCRTMLSVKTPEPSNEINNVHLQSNGRMNESQENSTTEAIVHPEDNSRGCNDSTPQKSKQATPLRSPKLVKEVLKRMSSYPSGRDPQVADTFSDEDDPDFSVEREAMKVIDAFDKSLSDFPTSEVIDKRQGVIIDEHIGDHKVKDNELQSDNLVEEVLLSDRKFQKILTGGKMFFGENFQGRDEETIESRRFMSLKTDQKSRGSSTRRESPAPPKPPRNYDSLPKGFKASDGEAFYDAVFSGIHPLRNGHSPDAANYAISHCSNSPQQNYFVVVAIDFGTTYSGYAFTFTQDPENIHMMRKWEGGDPGVVNQKTPTTLLLDPDEKFHSFGYAARDNYHDVDPEEAKKWLYFEKFKMTLHKTEHLSRETLIHAANGKGLPALTVFAHALRYFKEHALQELSDQSATAILNDDVRWVVTVPAIWRQPAKQFMRNAAYEAGIASPDNPEQLLIALEPEAASIFCRRLRSHQLIPLISSPQRLLMPNIKEDTESSQEPAVIENAGTKYMVVDCGGGTVDITVHEIIDENGTIKELHKATGGPYGSIGVDIEFEKLLGKIFGVDFVEQFKARRPVAFVELMVAFEARKRNASPFKITPINIALNFPFIDDFKRTKIGSIDVAVKKFGSKEIKWSSQGMLRLEPAAMMTLFQPTLDAIRLHVSSVLENCASNNISYLFLVGGFAESAILQKCIRDAFSGRLKVIIPQDVSLAILKGAVLFGVDPTVVSSRRSRLTYGVGVLNRFINGVHPQEKLVVKDGVEWCADVFDKFVLADQSVCVGDTVIRRYTPARSGQTCSVIHIYCSERENVQFITDPGVKRCGTLVLDLEDEKLDTQQTGKREIQTIMIFGDTELKVSAMDVLTGRCVKAEVDFLNG